jgi:hypothetical protein
MRGLGLTTSELDALPDWERRLYMRCEMYEDQRQAEIHRRSLEFIATIWCGPVDEPTDEKPVVEKTTNTPDGGQVSVKKVLDFEFEKRHEKMLAQSKKLSEETEDLVAKMKAELLEEKPDA